jgi:oxygen-independent coproporphyrinogen-3 oxidase
MPTFLPTSRQKICNIRKKAAVFVFLDENQFILRQNHQNGGMSCPLKDNILSLDRPVPRYTSYPPAPFFEPVTSQMATTEWRLLKTGPEKKLSLYFHVPFCPKLCWYCGCHTKITQRYAPLEDYLHLMMREIDIVSANLPYKNSVTHIHFGGGSPGMIRAVDFDKVMGRIRERFNLSPDIEISIELDPRNITEGRVVSYARNGVNRISLGIQDFNPVVLKAVNREQPFYLSYNALQLLRDYGIEKINFDLMYGLPHQTPETITETIKKALFLSPSRIAFFGYAHVPWMKKHMRLIDEDTLPDSAGRYDLFETGQNAITKAGFRQIGIDHFARQSDSLYHAFREKKLKRNFQGYTADAADVLIGLGASSISRIGNAYTQNAPDMGTYKNAVLTGKIPTWKGLELTAEDLLRSDIIEKIMCYGEADIGYLCQKHGFGLKHLDKELLELSDYIEQGLIILQNRKIIISKSPHFVMRFIANIFDSHKTEHPVENRHARAV